MLRRPLFRLLLALALVAAFVAGLAQLFLLRYQVGDIYPEYSSLRADPLGVKALASALEALPGVEVQRNYKHLPKLRPQGPVTLVYAGVDHRAQWGKDELTTFNELVVDGTRAVFTFYPVTQEPTARQEFAAKEVELNRKKKQLEERSGSKKSKDDKKKDKKKDDAGAKKTDEGAAKGGTAGAKKEAGDDQAKKAASEKSTKSGKSADDTKPAKESKDSFRDAEGEEHAFISFSDVAKRLGFSFGYMPEEKGKSRSHKAMLVEAGSHLEPEITWHSILYFKDLKSQWKVVYTCDKLPVVIERQVGSGSILLAADSYFMSNEALRAERDPLLLARVFSGPSPIVFDEDHNDLHENPGIASLARKYHLHGTVAGLVLLAILFVWKNMVRFVPAYAASSGTTDEVAGKDSGEGFINLLRRSIRPADIFGVCLAEWRKSFAGRPRELARVEEISAREASRTPGQRDPVATYREIGRALARKI